MYLYHLTLQQPTSIQTTAVGNFSGGKGQEILTVRGSSVLELLKVDPGTGKIKSICTMDTFSVIRSIAPFRLPGDDKDFIILGNDSGRIIVLQYSSAHKTFEKVHQETFGRSGCRRTIPGQYVASDPRGRAIMVSAVDRQKFVYVMNRDPTNSKLTISSPLEAHKASTIVYGCVGVDVGYDNPIFACLELEYGDLDEEVLADVDRKRSAEELLQNSPQKVLTFYELDLGLNHASRKWLETVSESANYLLAVPGGTDGPGGVLVCSENLVSWHNQGFDPISIPFPRRSVGTGHGTIITCGSLVKAKNVFFFLLQTEEGDLFKVSIDYTSDGVQRLRIRYFDSVAITPALAVLKSGFLFVPGESSNHIVYQIQSLGDHEDEVEYETGQENEDFMPRSLRNLAPIDQIENFSPLTAAKLMNLTGEESPQVYACQGKSQLSTFNIVRYGLGVTEIAQSELPAEPLGIWTLKNSLKDENHSMMILSFSEGTTALSIGDSIEEISDSGFTAEVSTLAAFQLANDAFIQVHSQGVRQISSIRGYSEWKVPSSASILHCAYNERQLVVYLENQSLVYFELDSQGNLTEKKSLSDLPEELSCMFLGPVPHERQRSRFLAVGSKENVVRIISLDPDDCLEPLSLQALAAQPSSLAIISSGEGYGLSLDVGLDNGVLVSLRVDPLSGSLSDAQTRYIGGKAIKLSKIQIEGEQAVVAVSSRPWLKYLNRGTSKMSPLFYDAMTSIAPFSSEQSQSGVVAIVGNTLRVISFDNLDSLFTRQRIPLEATPKKFAFNEKLNLFAFALSDCEGLAPDQYASVAEKMGKTVDELVGENMTFSGPDSTTSASVQIFDPRKEEFVAKLSLESDETCVSVSFVTFFENPNDQMIAVGIAKNFQSVPRSAESCSIDLYRLNLKKNSLELVHKTPVDRIPTVMIPFAGRLLAAVGGLLRLYDIGQKRLLRKCEARFPTFVVSLQSQGWRLTVGDAHESVFFVQYRHEENQFITFSDDTQPRQIASHCFLDYDTVAVADRFGNFAVMRLSSAISEAVETDGSALVAKQDSLGSSGNPLEKLVEYYLGDTIVSLHKSALVQGSREVIHYTTISGAIGVFFPFINRNDALLLQNLELFMRSESPATIAGRDHLSYRSSYNPVKAAVDGNLCELFMRLPADRKQAASQLLDISPDEIERKLMSMRSSVGF